MTEATRQLSPEELKWLRQEAKETAPLSKGIRPCEAEAWEQSRVRG